MKKYLILSIFILSSIFLASFVFASENCGTANNKEYTNLNSFSSNLCSSGRVLNFSSTYSNANLVGWKWKCFDGTMASLSSDWCSAKRTQSNTNPSVVSSNKYCGSANNQTFSSTPTSNLCSTGIPTTPVLTQNQYTWSCKFGSATLSSCSAQKTQPVIVNGQCGSSNNQTLSSAPTNNLCSSGTSSSVTGSGPWTWTCSGQNGGTVASCSAQKTQPAIVNGQCGSSNNQTLSSAPTNNLCSSGTSSSVTGSGPWTWTCSGQNGGTSVNCSAQKTQPINNIPINGKCGSAVDKDGYPPTNNLCSSGISSSVTGSGPWTWTCSGQNGGTSENCFVNREKDITDNRNCGSANSTVSSNPPNAGLCINGAISSSVKTTTYMYTWTCETKLKVDYCGSHILYPAVHGQCGYSHGQTLSSLPMPPLYVRSLCVSGNPSVVTGSGPWSWTCYGENGGSNVNCWTKKK